MTQNKSLSTQEVAEILHVSKSTIYDLIRRGEINSYKIGRKVRFTQDDVDRYIARARHEQSIQRVSQVSVHSALLHPPAAGKNPLIISGQDVVLDVLTNYLEQRRIQTHRCYLNSFEGLLALYEKRITAAACHLYDPRENEFNTTFVRKLMPGIPAVLINISYRKQGFYVAAGNPKEIHGWRDLARRDITILNRSPGTSARVLLDGQLLRMRLDHRQIQGYDREIQSHLTMAEAVARGEADLAVGTERVSRQVAGLEFIQLLKDRYDLVVRKEFMETPEANALLEILRSEPFRKEIGHFTGNDYRDTGTIVAEV